MITTQEEYDKLIDEDPFPFYKYNRLPEEEKTLSYLSMNGDQYENLVVAIANFGPQPFQGMFGTNFEPPGFERRRARQYNVHAGMFLPGPSNAPVPLAPPPSMYPPAPRPFSAPPGLSHAGPSGTHHMHQRNSPRLHNTSARSSRLVSRSRYDGTAEPGREEILLVEYQSPKTPAHRRLIVGARLSDKDEYEVREDDGNEVEDHDDNIVDRLGRFMLMQHGPDRPASTPSVRSIEEIFEMPSARVSLASSRTTPPKL